MKKGLSSVVTIILLILLVIGIISILWFLLGPLLNYWLDLSTFKTELLNERFYIQAVTLENGSLGLSVKRGPTRLVEYIVNLSDSPVVVDVPLDLVLVADRSGSMRQAGWNATVLVSPLLTSSLNVPNNGYSLVSSFQVPANTSHLLVALDWNATAGYDGSEASEFALNVRRPTNQWIFTYPGRPNNAGGVVDPNPQNSVGQVNEYYSGISTRPQYLHIENPAAGNWSFAVYGWNLRPRTSPPSQQQVSVSVYLGQHGEIQRGPTFISLEAMKSSLHNFIDLANLSQSNDRLAYVVFGSYAELRQGLSNDSTLLHLAVNQTGLEGGTAIHTGLSLASSHLLSTARPDAIPLIVLLTDGQNDAGSTLVLDAANLSKASGQTLFAIGLTTFVNHQLLGSIASLPQYYYYSPDGSTLSDVYQQVALKIQQIREQNITTQITSQYLYIVFNNERESYAIKEYAVPGSNLIRFYEYDLTGKISDVTQITISLGVKIRGRDILSSPLVVWTKKN